VDVSSLKSDVDGFSDELKSLTADEINQLANIGTSTISTDQWGYLGATDQGLATTDDVTFNNISVTGTVDGVDVALLDSIDRTGTLHQATTRRGTTTAWIQKHHKLLHRMTLLEKSRVINTYIRPRVQYGCEFDYAKAKGFKVENKIHLEQGRVHLNITESITSLGPLSLRVKPTPLFLQRNLIKWFKEAAEGMREFLWIRKQNRTESFFWKNVANMQLDLTQAPDKTLLIIVNGRPHSWLEWNRQKRQERMDAYKIGLNRKPWLQGYSAHDDLKSFHPECHHFLVRALWNKLSLKTTLSHYFKGQDTSSKCPHCLSAPETLTHIFRCSHTQHITQEAHTKLAEYSSQREWRSAQRFAHFLPPKLQTSSDYIPSYNHIKGLLETHQEHDPEVIRDVRNRVVLTASSIYRKRLEALRASTEDSQDSTISVNSFNLTSV